MVSLPSSGVWQPFSYLEPEPEYICILLNQPVLDSSLLVRLWNGAAYRATVDGGTSIWHKLLNNTLHKIESEVPDLITGDFDSADMDNVEYFKTVGSEVVETADQDRTDFTKCLAEIGARLTQTTDGHHTISRKSYMKQPQGEEETSRSGSKIGAIYAFVENSGRLDQIMANIQTLFLGAEYVSGLRIYLISSSSVTWLLTPGVHEIRLPAKQDLSGLHCGLIPISGPATLTTSGLKWNLNGDEMRFGGLVSTSNGFLESKVRVETNNDILFTMDLLPSV